MIQFGLFNRNDLAARSFAYFTFGARVLVFERARFACPLVVFGHRSRRGRNLRSNYIYS